ncbi:hypothetical protein B0H14DRAFT_2897197, partial [Mycena olivaceomarginata]
MASGFRISNRNYRWRASQIRRVATSDPPKKPRLDIRQLAIAGKPQACHSGRTCRPPRARPIPWCTYHRGRATFYQPVDHPIYDPQRLDIPAESVSTAVLFCCRQMYLESQPILYHANTFYVSVTELEMDIRSLYLYHSYRTTPPTSPPWSIVFPLLQQMHLKHLVFEFEIYRWTRWTQYNPRVDVLNDTWARSVLGIRTLSQFGLFLKDLNLQDVYRPNIEFRKLMIGSRAEESYRDYLEKWDETRIKHIPILFY